MTIGAYIKTRRMELSYTLEDVAKAVGVSRATVSRWESGDIHKMGADKIAALGAFLEIDPILLSQPDEFLSMQERQLLAAFRAADDRAKADALNTLIQHPKAKK